MKWKYRAELDRVVDGDTIDFDLDLGFGITKNVRVRLRDIDTAEIYGVQKKSEQYNRGRRHAEFVEEVLSDADRIIVQTFEDDETGKYGRYLAKVWVEGEGSLDSLLRENFDF